MTGRSRLPHWNAWRTGLLILALCAIGLTTWGVWSGSRSDYYASIALSMSQNWSNFFFGSFDPAGTVTLDKIPGSFWIPALFVKVFGFSTLTVILPNALTAVGATLLVAITAKRLVNPTAGILAGAAVAVTPILVAVSRSNQPETFFVLGLALTAWAAAKALQRGSFRWLMVAGVCVAASFQTYMLEAWAVLPALTLAYLFTRQAFLRKLWQAAVAAIVSVALSLFWIVIVSLVPASSRPYIGSTLHNSAWEMVFGYNGLGRFGSSGTDSDAYNSFTPPFSGSASVFRLFNEQLAGQIAWLIPAAILGIVILAVLRWNRALTVFLCVWLVTFFVMFSAVAGMHQFYTAALSVPMALTVGLAFGVARQRGVSWPQISVLGVAALTALGIAFVHRGYSIPVAIVQIVLAAAAIGLIIWERRRGGLIRIWTTLLVLGGLLLTPAVWSGVTLAHPSDMNPVAGGVAEMGGSGGAGGGPGGQGGMGGTRGGMANRQGGRGGAPDGTGNGQGGLGGVQDGSGSMQNGTGGMSGTGGGQGGASTQALSYLEKNKGNAKYLVAVFGAQSAANLIIESGGQSVLPIGGWSGSDPVPTLDQFTRMVASGQLKYVLLSEGRDGLSASGGGDGTTGTSNAFGQMSNAPTAGGMGGMPGNSSSSSSTSTEIREWVQENCSEVTDASISNLYQCNAD